MNSLSRFAVAAMAVAWLASAGFAQPSKQKVAKKRAAAPNAAALVLQRAIDSMAQVRETRRLDSARGADSVLRVADSLRRLDSLSRAAKTWYVVRPNHDAKDSAVASLFHQRLCIALRRTGKVFVAGDADTARFSWEASWQAAREAGASKVLLPSLRLQNGRVTVDVWIASSRETGRFDSFRVQSASNLPVARWAQALVDRLFPSPADSACRADSALQADRRWALAPSSSSDTTALRMLARRLGDGIRRSGRATWIEPDPADSLPLDSLLRSSGVTRLVRLKLDRAFDSAWVLHLGTSNLVRDTVFDSLVVVDPSLTHLVERAVPELFPAPPSCGALCGRPSTRSVWSVSVSGDPSRKTVAASLARHLHDAFRARTDRQFLSFPDSLPSWRLDSLARARGVTHQVRAHLAGDDSAWVLSVAVFDARNQTTDTATWRRGGPARRVFPWMARHVAGRGASRLDCDNSCRLDSLREQGLRWAVVAPPAADSSADSTAARLAKGFPRTSPLEILPGLPGCYGPSCLDSLAASRGLDRLVWSVRWRTADSAWAWQVKATDVVSDLATDSVTLVGSLADPDSTTRAAGSVWAALLPSRRCDSCIDRDTLEDALIVEAPRWDSATDSQRTVFRDAVVRTFATSNAYQLVPDPRSAPTRRSDLDSATRYELLCKSGAVYRMRSEMRKSAVGWRVIASIEEIGTGKVVASVDYQDKSKRADRPPQLAAWATRRLLGIESDERAPAAAGDPEVRKMLKLGIPAAVGILSVLLHW